MSEYTIKTVSGSVVRFDDAEDGLPLTNCEVNIVPKIETGTASGSVVAFSDGADNVPLKEFDMNIDSNLSGAPGIVVIKTGKNALPKFVVGTYTDNGITATVGEDNICRITGQNTSGGNALVVIPLEKQVMVSNQLYCHIRNNNTTTLSGLSMRLQSHWPSLSTVNRIFTVTNSQKGLVDIAIQVAGSQTSELDFTVNPSFEYSNVETGYEPYKEEEVIEVGIPNNNNIFDKTKTDTGNGFVENKYLQQSGVGSMSQNYNISEYIVIEGGKNYVLNNCSGNAPSIVFYDSSKSIISGTAYSFQTMITVQAPQNAAYCRISIPKANVDILHLKKYMPIYGGSVDVLNGTGKKTHGKAIFTGSEVWHLYSDETFWYTTLQADNIKVQQNCTTSNNVVVRYQSTSGQLRVYLSANVGVVDIQTDMNALLSNGVSFSYPYETPEDFTFTPIPTNSWLGNNTMWSDWNLDVTYYKKGYNTKKVNILHCEKNILKISDNNYNNGQRCNYIITENGIEVTALGTYARAGFAISIKKGETYTFSFRGYATSTYKRIYLSPNIDTPWSSQFWNQPLTDTDAAYSKTFTASTDILFIGFYVTASETTGTMTISDIMLELSSSVTSFEPYSGENHVVNLGRSINGGTINVFKGTGISKYAMAALPDCSWTCITSYQSNFNSTNGIISVRFGKTAMGNAGYALTTEGVVCNNFANNNRSVWNNVDRLNEIGYTDGITINMHYSDIGLEAWTDNSSTTLAAWKSSELYLSGIFALIKAEPEPFTFTPIQLTANSSNTLWSTEGDITVSYYSYIETDGRYLISGSTLTDIADAIREKTSIVGPINVNDFITDIMTIDDSAPDAEEVEF